MKTCSYLNARENRHLYTVQTETRNHKYCWLYNNSIVRCITAHSEKGFKISILGIMLTKLRL